jgi:hypothetical protein
LYLAEYWKMVLRSEVAAVGELQLVAADIDAL